MIFRGPWLRRIAWTIGLLAAAGGIYQAIATQLDRRHYPAPGRLVDVGGYRLHMNCVGEGSPTVVLDAAADMMSADWGWIQPEIAKVTRVCAYDRAGMGWSEPGPLPRDARQVSAELHTLLSRSGVSGPYVLVGHSAAALYARVFAAQYPLDVVGMVLVDPAHPDMANRVPALQSRDDARLVETMRVLAYFGIPRLLGIGKANARGLAPQPAAEVSASTATPGHWATIGALIDSTPASYEETRLTGDLGSRPIVVISANTAWATGRAPADETRRALNRLHAELAALSTNGRHRVVDGATHGSLVHDSQHAGAVVAALQDVLTSVRTGRPLRF